MPQPPKSGRLFGKLCSRRIDLVGDFAGQEPFLVDGDSLLLHCFCDRLLEFEDGYQMLHAVWLVERFLASLKRRNCNFDVAFCDQNSSLCIPSDVLESCRSKYPVAREVILRHLEVNLARTSSSIRVLRFTSLDSPEFLESLVANSYMFVMMNDGSAPSHTDHVKQLRAAIYDVVAHGYSVALINGLEFRDTKVITEVIEGRPTKTKNRTVMTEIKDECDGLQMELDMLCELHRQADEMMTERLCLVAVVTGLLVRAGKVSHPAASAFAVHAVLTTQLPLSTRSAYNCVKPRRNLERLDSCRAFLDEFNVLALNVLRSAHWKTSTDKAGLVCDLADLLDGKLLFHVRLESFPLPPLSAKSKVLLTSMGKIISSVARAELVIERPLLFPADQKAKQLLSGAPPKLLPFMEPSLDKHLQPVQVRIDATDEQGLPNQASRIFRELTHWHSAKRPIDRKALIASKDKAAARARRQNQRYMAEMIAYAASVTNAVGKALKPKTIVVKSDKEPSGQHQTATKGSKNNRGKKQAVLASRAAEIDKKDVRTATKITEAWGKVCKDTLERADDPSVRYGKTMQYLQGLSDAWRTVVSSEVELYALNCMVAMWRSSVHAKSPDYGLAARIWDAISSIRHAPNLTASMKTELRKVNRALGFPFSFGNAAATIRQLPFAPVWSLTGVNLKVPLPSKEFQLLHCGPYFDRKIDAMPDSRVDFAPDGWQRQVLDVIDANKSLFVVAPTSAGKTFISFYAMEKVLEKSDDGVIVYIAPTKPLVNQIAAEIQARYSKTYKHSGKSVWGIHTRDYRVNSCTGCQVLVTVPHILQIMLLAPSHVDSWSVRIKRIIFDEVHCIGQAEDGIVWEQLLLLSPCPIIALSATVGNPKEFHEWLASTQRSLGHELVMVHHPHRYSALRMFVHATPKKFTFKRLPAAPQLAPVGLDNGDSFHFVHPVSSLTKVRGIPEDFSLEARDCYTLWQAMKCHECTAYPVEDSLSPEKALPAVIAQKDVIDWGQRLKRLLGEWMRDGKSPFQKVVADFSKPHDMLNDGKEIDLVTTALPLICDLHAQAALPAILFNYDRAECERMCKQLLNDLKKAEKAWKESSPAWKKKIATWEAWKKNHKNAERSARRAVAAQPEAGMSKADMDKEAASVTPDKWESFNPNAPIDGFHFADYTKLPASELAKYADGLKWRGVAAFQIEALSRGIAFHHSGANRRYRQVVEVLFRKGYLRIVIATGTLALGINMPCKTVVFCGDSVFLTALNFRQAAGRAGRRGFDVLGNVVFHGIPLSKVYRLQSSRLPELTGHFPTTTTLVLRLCSLLAESKQSPFVVRMVDALVSQPRLYLGGQENRMSVLHHLRFSIEYLRRQYLLNSTGHPINFAGCVSHLYYTEPSNFAFHALLKDGYFHRLCAGIRSNPRSSERILKTLMLVMSHHFGRQYLRNTNLERIREKPAGSPSVVVLPPMPEEAATILRHHNRETLNIFTEYVRSYVTQHLATEPDGSLPLTGMRFGGMNEEEQGQHTEGPTIRSPFVGLSGHSDETITSIHELCSTVRAGVFLEEAVIPQLPVEAPRPLNAYLLDFFKHGDTRAIVEDNGVRRGELWFVLHDFALVLATIVTSLTGFVKGEEARMEDDEIEMDGEGEEIEEEDMKEMTVESKPLATVSLSTAASTKKPSKKKVLESWDDEDEEEDGEPAADLQAVAGPTVLDNSMNLPSWASEDEGSLLDVLAAFRLLSEEFQQKFKAMWV